MIVNLIAWLDAHQGSVMSLLTLVYVIATILILIANTRSVKEMKKTREEENRPYVVAYYHRKPSGFMNLIIQNVGKTLAEKVIVNVEPKMHLPQNYPLSESHLLSKPIANIPPNFIIKAYAGKLADYKKDDRTYPIYDVVVTYEGQSGNKYKGKFVLDLNVELNRLRMDDERDINDLTKEVEKFNNKYGSSMDTLNQQLSKLVPNSEDDNKVFIDKLL